MLSKVYVLTVKENKFTIPLNEKLQKFVLNGQTSDLFN